MASIKERARWERWYDQVTARLERQKQALTRMTLMHTEMLAALMEIKAMSEDGESFGRDEITNRTQEALDRVEQMRLAGSGNDANPAESTEGEDPILDPRNPGREQ